ncbi:Stomatin (EPB72)-like 1 [Mactra antiquata]
MSAKYSRLPTADPELGQQVQFDYSSAHNFGYGAKSLQKYESIFTYDDPKMRMKGGDVDLVVVKQSLVSRVCEYLIIVLSVIFCVLTFPISAWLSIKIVSDSDRLVIFRLGRLQGVKGPGMTFVIPCVDTVKKVDVRMKAFTVPPLQVLTSDAGIIELGADVYYSITDAVKSIAAVQDLNTSLRGLVRNTFTTTLTKLNLQAIDDHRNHHIAKILDECNSAANRWGVYISRIEMSPIKVLQAAKGGPSLSDFGGQDGLSQVFQQLAGSLMGPGQASIPSPISIQNETVEASGAAVSSEDVNLIPHITPAYLVEIVRGVLSESLVKSVDAIYQFNMSGENGGIFHLDLKHGSGQVGVGPVLRVEPDVTLDLSVRDMQLMFSDKLRPLQAYMNGRLKITGDLSTAMRLEEVMDKIISSANSSSVAGHTVVTI